MANLVSFIRRLFRMDEPATGDPGRSNLEFFSNLSATLEVELTEPAEPVANLANLAAKPEAEIVDVRLCAQVFEEKEQDFRDLTEEELALVVLAEPRIRLRGEAADVIEHEAPDGRSFTVREMLAAIEETERRTRGNSEWLGGIDVHHCFFEGIYQAEDGVWQIEWGS